MINLKVTMLDGREYNVRNLVAEDVKEFIRLVFTPFGVQLKWCEIVPGEWIYVQNISCMRVLTNKELGAIKNIKGGREK